MEILRTEHLTYKYGIDTPYEKIAIDDVSISVNEGEIIGIIGHTGSGKSTLIEHFNGLLKPFSGSVYFRGKDIYSDKNFLHDIKFKVGIVFQYPEYQLFEETVEKDIAFGPKNMKLDESAINRNVSEAMRLVGLSEGFRKKSPFDLSGGQKRRVAIAGVIAMRPEILILDEPTAGLDPKGQKDIFDMLMKYHSETGSTILMVLHNMEAAAKYSDRLLVMNNAKVFAFDTPEKIFLRSEEIVKMGLDVPQITKVILNLKKHGIELGDNIYTVERAKEVILKYIRKSKGESL